MNNSIISVFFPAFNEEKTIKAAVSNAISVIPGLFNDYEIIIVDDGSTDKTPEICSALAKENRNIRVVRHPKNLGYGAALKSGFSSAGKELVFFTDGDNQFDISEIKTFLPHLQNADLVIGYRLKRKDSWHRLLFGIMFRLLVGVAFNLWVKDVDCAFKLIKKDVLKDMVLKSDGALINTELLVRSKKKGFRIKEVGVHHFPRKGGKATGGNIKVIVKAFYEIIKLFRELR
jgi:glycosyltransferase involved in cell wall biosynthesis